MVPSAHSWKQPAQIAYSMNDAMAALRISRATIYKLIDQNLLKTYQIGRRRYCTHQALVDLQHVLEAESTPPAAA